MPLNNSQLRKTESVVFQRQPSSRVAPPTTPTPGPIRVLSRQVNQEQLSTSVSQERPTKNKKRKPTLKTMCIGNMIPAGALDAGKGKRQIRTQARPATSQTNPPPTLNSSQEVPSVATKSSSSPSFFSGGRSREGSGPYIDLTEFPSLSETRRKVDQQGQRSPPRQRNLKVTKPAPKRAEPSLGAPKRGLSATAPVFRLHDDRSAPTASSAVKDRDMSGDEHALLLLMQQGKFVVQSKGRQRIRPRKKKFSALKKKVLQERLLKWRELHAPATVASTNQRATAENGGGTNASPCTVCIRGFVDLEELEDDDEFDEIVSNLRDMALKVGPVRWVFVPRTSLEGELTRGEGPVSFVEFEHEKDASAASACWNGLALGGQILETRVTQRSNAPISEEEWRTWCLQSVGSTNDDHSSSPDGILSEIVLEGALTDDDLEDDDCLEESLKDIGILASSFGKVAAIRAEKIPKAQVYIQYEEPPSIARRAALEFGNLTIGGSRLTASVMESSGKSRANVSDVAYIVLGNVLTEEDMEDDDCLQESLADIRELAQRYGDVTDVCLDSTGNDAVRVYYGDFVCATLAATAFSGLTIGGVAVTATAFGRTPLMANNVESESISSAPPPLETKETGPMFSKDKRIPEQFARCLRVPKVPNSGQPRKYATLLDNDNVKPLLIEMLGELMRLQKRAVEDKNAKARRRLVLGLREVARGIRAHKVKLVVMANNLDEYGAIDQKLQEILDLSHEESVPVFFELSKRALGKAVGKSIKVSVVGVQNADGAHQAFKKLLTLAPSY